MGEPCVLSGEGLARVVELPLNEQERAAFERSAEGVRNDIARLP
jgi:malate dehydrogenase